MATYCFLQEQALQGDGRTAQAQQVSPAAAPFPSLDAAAAFSLELRKNGSAPAFGTLLVSSSNQVSAYGQHPSQRGGKRSTGPGLLPLRPLQSVSGIHSTSSLSENNNNENTEDNLLPHRAPVEDKPIPSRVRPKGFKGGPRI